MLKAGVILALAVVMLAGCTSKQDQAIETAKKQAAATGQAQQVVSVDKNGTTTMTTIQPPAPGQTAQSVTTTTTPPATPQPGQTSSGPANAPANGASYAAGNGPANGPGYSPTAGNGGQSSAQAVAGGAPVIRPADVHVPAGTTLAIRVNQHISVKTTPAGSRFDGELADSYTDENGRVILPKGTPVDGVVDASHKRGHFKGASILQLRLTALTLNGARYPIETNDLTRTKKGKGKRSAAFIGGGTGLGMLIGGLAGGGPGLLIGGLAGAGTGTAVGGLTGNRDLDIPSESIVRFKLANNLTLRQ